MEGLSCRDVYDFHLYVLHLKPKAGFSSRARAQVLFDSHHVASRAQVNQASPAIASNNCPRLPAISPSTSPMSGIHSTPQRLRLKIPVLLDGGTLAGDIHLIKLKSGFSGLMESGANLEAWSVGGNTSLVDQAGNDPNNRYGYKVLIQYKHTHTHPKHTPTQAHTMTHFETVGHPSPLREN